MTSQSLTSKTSDHLDRFIHLCMQGRWDPSALDSARGFMVQHGVDWQRFLEIIRFENLAPLLYSILRGQDILPQTVEAELHQGYNQNRSRNILVLDEMKSVLQCLDAANVPVLLLKGAALAASVYQDPAVRIFRDVDILCSQIDIPVASRTLAEINYHTRSPDLVTGAAMVFENEILMVKPGWPEIHLELHWSLFNSPYFQHTLIMDWFWESAQSTDFFGVPARILCPEAQLLHLCAHLILHHEGRELLWLHDIAEVIEYYQDMIQWEILLAKAHQNHLVLPVRQALEAVSDGWRVHIPKGVIKQLASMQVTSTEARVFDALTDPSRSVGRRFWDDLWSLPRWGMRARFTLNNVFPSSEYMLSRYQISTPALLWAYYPYRWYLGLRSVLAK